MSIRKSPKVFTMGKEVRGWGLRFRVMIDQILNQEMQETNDHNKGML